MVNPKILSKINTLGLFFRIKKKGEIRIIAPKKYYFIYSKTIAIVEQAGVYWLLLLHEIIPYWQIVYR